MMMSTGILRRSTVVAAVLIGLLASRALAAQAGDPLPSWNDGKTKLAILGFVTTATRRGAPGFVPPAERIATFDNDGTLWAEPMRELLTYLRVNGFKTFIVSGGGIEFMRAWTERVYGIPPEQVVGSCIKTTYELRDGKPVPTRLPEMNFVDDKAGKPVAIQMHIGRRPVAAFGNSDGDLEMLQWTCLAPGPRFCLVVHHTDEAREWAYDRSSSVGRLDKALDEAQTRGWTVVDMKRDWKVVFPFERK